MHIVEIVVVVQQMYLKEGVQCKLDMEKIYMLL